MTAYKEIDIQCNKIREMLADPAYHNYKDIHNALGLKRAAYYRRLVKIQQEDKAASLTNREIRQDSMTDSVTRITNALENASSITYEISNNKKEKTRDRILAIQMYLTTETWIYQNNHVIGKPYSFPKIFDIKPKSLDITDNDFEVGDKFDK